MFITRFQKITLGIAGVTALGIGAFILSAPHTFYASYGIELGADASLLSELRAPAASLAALGVVMFAGIVRPAWWQVSTAVALTVFLAFPIGRIIGLAADGLPSASVLGALAIEVFHRCTVRGRFLPPAILRIYRAASARPRWVTTPDPLSTWVLKQSSSGENDQLSPLVCQQQ